MDNQTSAPDAAELPNVPETWPGAFGAYKYSKQAVKRDLKTLTIIWLLNVIVSGGIQLALHKARNAGGTISYILGSLFTIAFTLTYLEAVRGRRVATGDILRKSLPLWLKSIGLSILIFLSVVASILLLIIPFFFVYPRLRLAFYFLVDQNLGVVDAYKASWNTTKGHAGYIWGMIGASAAMALLIVTIIGIPFAIYYLIMYSGVTAVFYEYLTKSASATTSAQTELPTPSAPPTTPTPPTPPSPQNPPVI